jgi:hypothetical protein
MSVITRVRDSDWRKDDGTTVRVTTLRFEDGTEAPGYDLPSVPEVGKPLPDGWEVATSKAGKPYVKVPKSRNPDKGGMSAYRNTKEGQAFEQQQMNRRTALMQAVAYCEAVYARNDSIELWGLSNTMYEWLQSSPVLGRAAAAPTAPSAGDTPVGTGADDEGGSGGSGADVVRKAASSPNPGPSSPDCIHPNRTTTASGKVRCVVCSQIVEGAA